MTVDFLIQPSLAGDKGGKLRDIEPDFAAIIAPGLRCAFQDRQRVTLEGRTLFNEKATREIWVCGAGAYVVLKALAFDSRGENKDAYEQAATSLLARLGPGSSTSSHATRGFVRVSPAQVLLRL